MRTSACTTRSHRSGVSRRAFLGAAAAATVSIVPPCVLGGPGQVPPSDRVNLAFIGVGSQGLRVMLNFLRNADVQAVAVCDPNRSSDDYPQWQESEFRNRYGRWPFGSCAPTESAALQQ